MGVSLNGGTPKSSIFNRVFPYKPSILGNPHILVKLDGATPRFRGFKLWFERPSEWYNCSVRAVPEETTGAVDVQILQRRVIQLRPLTLRP